MIAAAIGASIGIFASGLGGLLKKDTEAAMANVRLTSAVEHIAAEVSMLRGEIKTDRQELYPRINAVEQRIAVLETRMTPPES